MLILSFLMLIFGCEKVAVEPEIGIIEGKVIISPLCGNIPAETNNSNPCGFTDEQLNQIYSKYQVLITGSNGKEMAKIVLNKTGLFAVELPVGTYRVEVLLPAGTTLPNNTLTTNSLKKTITVLKNQVTKLEIMVDTGIR